MIYSGLIGKSAPEVDTGIVLNDDKITTEAENATSYSEEKPFSEWKDICVKSVKPIAVGNTKPFSPWSPDGKKIFFYGPDKDNGNKQSVWIAVLKECSDE